MVTAFSNFNGLEMFFLTCAVIGGFIFIVQFILQFVGGDANADLGVDSDFGIDSSLIDSDIGFRLLSLHGLSAFFMMFGLVGLASYRQSQAGVVLSIVGAIVAGIVSVWVIGKLFQTAARLQSSGTLKTREAIGSTGTVYLTIPEKGTGRVTINFKNHLREFDASSKTGGELPTGTPIRVVRVNANILEVEVIK